jgi:hypothetical protein
MVVAAPQQKPWLLSADEVTILKNAVCKGATDEELKFCLTVARRYEFDPFQKQIWFVRRWDSEALNSEGKKGSYVWTPQVSIDGLCYQAASHHADYGSFSEVEYGPMVDVPYNEGRSKLKAPEWARIEAFKKGDPRPTVGKVWWSEIYPDIDRAPLVRRMPRLMLGKCAKAQAIRAAYPKTTGGLLIPEETHGREFTDITPGGRIVTPVEVLSPSEQNWAQREAEGISKLTPDQQKVVKSKMADATIDRPTDCLFYVHVKESGTYTIDGAQSLKQAHRDLLRDLWSPTAGAIVATPAQLGKLISQFEFLKVPFREWPPPKREPGE